MSQKRWKLLAANHGLTAKLAAETGLPEPVARVLVLRGFDTAETAREFMEPRLADLTDPFLLPGMDKAVRRIWQAIDRKETITIFGDYDVDGVTSAALLTRVLCELGAIVKPFIPDRFDEGYGLSKDALERCLEDHRSTLVISVDCGVNSVESVSFAKQQGVDVIVTDHHEPEAQTAPAFALINPKLGTVPELANLSGVGVAFKLAHGLVKTGRSENRKNAAVIDLRDYLDIAALGTVADIVPLIKENRIIVRYGLEKLAESKWPGMTALKDTAGMRGEPDTYHLGFQLGPRINAAGRIGQPMEALMLLITPDPSQAKRIAKLLDETNIERRRIEHEIAERAFEEIDAYFNPAENYGLVVAGEGWHPGVVGIVATRVSQRYNRPAIVMGIEPDGNACGSCRSISEYSLLEGLHTCADLLNRFGGHKMAAGVEVKSGQLETFKIRFNAAVKTALENIDLSPVQQIDAVVSAEQLDRPFYEQLRKLKPFGQGNPEPIWALKNAQLSGVPRIVGQNHLKLTLLSDGKLFDAIAFNYYPESLPEGAIDVAFTLTENHWNGSTALQLQIKDIRPAAKL